MQPEPVGYFKRTDGTADAEEGTRDLLPLAPFVISGGKNTERYYFIHINNLTDYKINVKPEYFGNESKYTEVFPKQIAQILKKNTDAKVFCVFDMDTVYKNESSLKKHKSFINELQDKIDNGRVVICDSMPCFEYWLLLHFRNHTDLLNNYREVSQLLAPYIKSYFAAPKQKLSKLLKSEKHVNNPVWVENLLKDEKLPLAMKRAKDNLKSAEDNNTIDKCSYTKIYKIFEYIECFR